jgi:hypothetical protein
MSATGQKPTCRRANGGFFLNKGHARQNGQLIRFCQKGPPVTTTDKERRKTLAVRALTPFDVRPFQSQGYYVASLAWISGERKAKRANYFGRKNLTLCRSCGSGRHSVYPRTPQPRKPRPPSVPGLHRASVRRSAIFRTVIFRNLTDDAAWVADRKNTFRNVSGDHAPCSDDRA